MKWQNKLTKTELKHLKEMGVTTLLGAKRNAEHQQKLRNETPETFLEPCWECRRINNKLDLPI